MSTSFGAHINLLTYIVLPLPLIHRWFLLV